MKGQTSSGRQNGLRVIRTRGDFPQAEKRTEQSVNCCTTTCCATLLGGAAGLLSGGILGLVLCLKRKLRPIPAEVPGMSTGLVKLRRKPAAGQFDEEELVPVLLRNVYAYYAAAFVVPLALAGMIVSGSSGLPGGGLVGTAIGLVLAARKVRAAESFQPTRTLRIGRGLLYVLIYAFFGLLLGAGVGFLIDTQLL